MAHIVHIVLVEWHRETPLEIRNVARDMIQRFATRISGIAAVVEGPSVSPENLEDGLDYGFVITFDDAEARNAYLPHPVHVELADLLGAHCSKVIVYDVESADAAPRAP